jgi:hypothetical protein
MTTIAPTAESLSVKELQARLKIGPTTAYALIASGELTGHSYRAYWPGPRGFWERIASRLRRGWEHPIRPKATSDVPSRQVQQ